MNATPTVGLLFDLDGTLADTLPGVADVVNRLRRDQGLPPVDTPTVGSWIGGGLERMLIAALKITPLPKTVFDAFYAAYLGPPLTQAPLYPGIAEVLAATASLPRAIVTNKPQRSVDMMVADRQWQRVFDPIVTPEFAGVRKPDAGMIAAATRRLPPVRHYLMIGDSEFDILAARQAGAYAVAVTWGYRSRATLAAHGPDWLIDEPAQLMEIIAGLGDG